MSKNELNGQENIFNDNLSPIKDTINSKSNNKKSQNGKSSNKRNSPCKKKISSPTKKIKDEANNIYNVQKVPNEINKFNFLYSPRTEFSNRKKEEEELFNDLSIGFDPITIKIIKNNFKERMGSLTKLEFINILKNHLLSWHPELPDRKDMLIKFLAKLFGEIDLNDNGQMEWDEFTNYIINSSNNNNVNNIVYKLKQYSLARTSIDDRGFTEIISYAFYIEKFNLIGLVQDNKSYIMFYDGITCKKLKNCSIDVKDTQSFIDEIEVQELDKRAEELFKREEEIREIKKKKHEENCKKMFEEMANKYNKNYNHNKNNSINNNINSSKNANTSINASIANNDSSGRDNNFKKDKKEKDRNNSPQTPEHLKKELAKLKYDNINIFQKSINKKLTILSTVFIPEYDTLLISSSNNKISAWKYKNGEFKNINKVNKNKNSFSGEEESFSCAIQTTNVPQYTLTWDPIQQFLYSGQADGKILKWQLSKSKNLENDTFDYAKAKSRHDKEMKNNNNNNNDLNENNFLKMIDRGANKHKSLKDFKKMKTGMITDEKNENNENASKAIILNSQEERKRDGVSCITILGKLQLLASGYFNGNIILWDTMLKDYRKYYTDQETGIYQLIYEPIKNLIFSCGFDHDIYIYDPYIDCAAVYKLIGHNSSINSVDINSLENELISIDINGIIKVWDINKYYNYQTINLNENYTNDKKLNNDIQNSKKKKISSNLKMIYLSKINKILTYGDKFFMFEKNNALNPDLCDDQIILGCYYNPYSYDLICVCLHKIKIWDVFNGKVKKIYEELMANEITAFALDCSKKRIYLGDNTGKIKNFNMNNGKYLKDFDPHNSEIATLLYSDKLQMLISLSANKIVKCHEDVELLQTSVLKEIDLNQMNVSALSLSNENNRLLIGLNGGQTKFYNIDNFRFDTDIDKDKAKKYNNDEVFKICPIDKTDIIFISHLSGRGKFMVIPPNPGKFTIFGEFKNVVKQEGKDSNTPVISVAYDDSHKHLIAGDQFGFVHGYDLKPIFRYIKKYNNQFEKTEESEKELNDIVINEVFLVQAGFETIKYIYCPKMDPHAFITTSNDRKVKIYSVIKEGEEDTNNKFYDKSEENKDESFNDDSDEEKDDYLEEDSNKIKYTCVFIDELKQVSSKYKEIPIGIEFYYSDPFVSKRNKDDKYEKSRIYRDKLVNYKPNANKNNLRYESVPINDYSKIITEQNAKEKLYYITKNCDIDLHKSNKWNLNINLNSIKRKEKKFLRQQLNIEKDDEKQNKKFDFYKINTNIYSDEYKPYFVDIMSDQELEGFQEILSQKLRHAKLSIAKAEVNRSKYEQYEKENNRKKNFKTSTENLDNYDKKKNIKSSTETLKTERNENKNEHKKGRNKIKLDPIKVSKNSKELSKSYNFKNPLKQIDSYKLDFDKNLEELEYSINNKLYKSINKLLLPKLKKK